MSEIKIYLYANCSSCRKADALLQGSGINYDRRDIFKKRMKPEEIRRLLTRIGRSAFDVLSKRSIAYRELDLANRAVNEDELIDLMSAHPGLLRRPIVVSGEGVIIGFKQKEMKQLVDSVGAN